MYSIPFVNSPAPKMTETARALVPRPACGLATPVVAIRLLALEPLPSPVAALSIPPLPLEYTQVPNV